MVRSWVPSGILEALVAGASSQGAGLIVSEWPWENTGLSASCFSSSPPLREDSLTVIPSLSPLALNCALLFLLPQGGWHSVVGTVRTPRAPFYSGAGVPSPWREDLLAQHPGPLLAASASRGISLLSRLCDRRQAHGAQHGPQARLCSRSCQGADPPSSLSCVCLPRSLAQLDARVFSRCLRPHWVCGGHGSLFCGARAE